jgi:hypothetical protein
VKVPSAEHDAHDCADDHENGVDNLKQYENVKHPALNFGQACDPRIVLMMIHHS